MITLSALNAAAHGQRPIRHAFFTRQGGVSDGIFASLNCGFGSADAPANVDRNRELAARHFDLAADRLVTCHQVHGTTVIIVDRPWHRSANPRADGMVSATPGIAIGVLAADCAPVLFADPEAGVIGAAHGGWRGTLSGVMEETVMAMTALGAAPHRIHAGIGPCIAQQSYEVGPEFPGIFVETDVEAIAYFKQAPRAGHFLFNLPSYIAHRLERLGLAAIGRTPHDTVAEESLFFSYRRACLQGETDYGRGLAAIAISE